MSKLRGSDDWEMLEELAAEWEASEATEATDTEAAESTDTEATEATDTEAAEATDTEAAESTDTEAAESTDTEAAESTEEENIMKTENELLYEKGLNRLHEMFATERDMHRGAMEAGARWGVDNALLAAETEAWEARGTIINKHIAAMEMARRCEENKRMGDVKRSQVAALKRFRNRKPKTELDEAERAALIEALDYVSIDI